MGSVRSNSIYTSTGHPTVVIRVRSSGTTVPVAVASSSAFLFTSWNLSRNYFWSKINVLPPCATPPTPCSSRISQLISLAFSRDTQWKKWNHRCDSRILVPHSYSSYFVGIWLETSGFSNNLTLSASVSPKSMGVTYDLSKYCPSNPLSECFPYPSRNVGPLTWVRPGPMHIFSGTLPTINLEPPKGPNSMYSIPHETLVEYRSDSTGNSRR